MSVRYLREEQRLLKNAKKNIILKVKIGNLIYNLFKKGYCKICYNSLF